MPIYKRHDESALILPYKSRDCHSTLVHILIAVHMHQLPVKAIAVPAWIFR